MSTTSSTEIQQLKEFIGDRFNQLDNKIDEIKKDLQDISRNLIPCKVSKLNLQVF